MSTESPDSPTPADIARRIAARAVNREILLLSVSHDTGMRTITFKLFNRQLPGIGDGHTFYYHDVVMTQGHVRRPSAVLIGPSKLRVFASVLENQAHLEILELELRKVRVRYLATQTYEMVLASFVTACASVLEYEDESSIVVI
jgi:hypothetical protein